MHIWYLKKRLRPKGGFVLFLRYHICFMRYFLFLWEIIHILTKMIGKFAKKGSHAGR